MSDVMFYGVLRMPFELAMSDYMSQRQFYDRAQEAADRVEAADKRIAELEAKLQRMSTCDADLAAAAPGAECKSCAILRRYEKTARERGYAMGKAAGNNELAQAQELLAFERKAHAETNAALTAEITRLEAQLAAAAPGADEALPPFGADCWLFAVVAEAFAEHTRAEPEKALVDRIVSNVQALRRREQLAAAPRDLTQEEVEDSAKACHGLDMGDSWSLGHDMLAEFAATVRAIK